MRKGRHTMRTNIAIGDPKFAEITLNKEEIIHKTIKKVLSRDD